METLGGSKQNPDWSQNCVTKGLSIILAMIFFTSLVGCSKPIAEENHALREQGMALCVAGKTKEAAAFFKKKLATADKSADAHYGLGAAYAADGEYDKAIAEFDRAIDLNPHFEEAYNDRGNQYLAKKLYDQAVADYTAAIKFGAQHSVHWSGRSRANFEKGDFANARMDATEAISRSPRWGPVYVRRARAEQALDLQPEAQADINIALNLPANSKYEFVELGNYLWHDGAPSSALKQYDKAIALAPKDHTLYKSRSACHQAMGNLVKARADLNLAAHYAPEADWYAVSFLILNDLDYDAAHCVSEPLQCKWEKSI